MECTLQIPLKKKITEELVQVTTGTSLSLLELVFQFCFMYVNSLKAYSDSICLVVIYDALALLCKEEENQGIL